MNQMDINGNVKTNIKCLPSLKVCLVSEVQPDTPVPMITLTKKSFFYLPSLVMDNKNYLLSLESSLSRSEYDYKLPSIEFPAIKSHTHFTFEFDPKPKAVDQNLNQGSFLLLPLIANIIALSCNYKIVIPYVTSLSQQVQSTYLKSSSQASSSSSTSSSSAPASTASDIPIPSEFLGSESSPVKRKVKPRKAQ